jgi:uncharacterized protein YbjT (DUF2867 family)
MARVLVTGGTGTLGSVLVARLALRGHEVRSFSRHGQATSDGGTTQPAAISQWRGDVRSGEGLDDALGGVDTVIHTATAGNRAVEVEGTAKVVAAAGRVHAHLLYISIVGVDQMKLGYYRAKFDAEKLVESGPAPWTIQRATQFHDLLDRFLSWHVFPVTRHAAFQPVDVGDVSDRLVNLVEAGPSGRAPDFGGPAVRPLRDLAATRRQITGSGTFLLPLPAVGMLKDFDEGRHLCPDHANGSVGWEQWLRSRSA